MDASRGKRRSFAQRVGTRGENEFRIFADRQGLIATKVDDDFGTDFFCEIDLDHTSAGVSSIGNTIISACVRSTTKKTGRIKLEKSDAMSLLRARGCIMLVLVHLKDDTRESNRVYFRFIDADFNIRLRKFVRNENKSTLTITPGELNEEANFRSLLLESTRPGFTEEVAIHAAKNGILEDVADVEIEVHRSSSGSYTAVSTFNFYDFFERLDPTSRRDLYQATFGVPVAQQDRITKLAVRADIFDHLEKLPHPYVIGGITTTEDVELTLTSDQGTANCKFIFTRNGEHFGWIHPSGCALTVSKSKQMGDRWVHEMEAFFDPIVITDFSDIPDLVKFLQAATPEATLSNESGYTANASYFQGLMNGGQMARDWEAATSITGWRSGIVHLRDIGDFETHTTMGFLRETANNPDSISQASFFVDYATDSNIANFAEIKEGLSSRSAELIFPVVANTRNITVIVTFTCTGEIYTTAEDPDSILGVSLLHTKNTHLTTMPLIQKGTLFPEIIIAPGITTIPLGLALSERPDHVRVPDELSTLEMKISPLELQ
jgi:hypothetical protein